MSFLRVKNWFKAQKVLYGPIKSYYYLKYIKKYVKRELYVPKTLVIETTSFCNAQCIMCPRQKMKRAKGYMSWGLFKKIIDECKSFEGKGLKIFLHKDGEPLLDFLLFQRIKYIKQELNNSTVQLSSNAMLLDEDKAQRLLSSGIDGVIFSVDGASRETFEQIRAGLNYDAVKRNIDRFIELKKDKFDKPQVIMQMVVGEDNKHEIEKFKRLWLGKADVVHFKAMHSFLDMKSSMKTKNLGRRQLAFCNQPYECMVIDWDGNVGLCCWDYDNMANLGDIQRYSLINVYNNEKFKIIRDAMGEMDCSTIVPCNRCAAIYGKDLYHYFRWERDFYTQAYL